MSSPQDEIAPSSTGWRFKAGIAILSLTVISWLTVPLAAAADVPGPKIAALTGILFISNKILLILAIAVMGKSGFQQLKRNVFGYVSTLAPAADLEVGPARHRIGMVMFCLPLISSFLEPYVDTLWPGLRPNLWQVQVLGDALLVGSFFVLGGNFWDKVRALFIRTARVVNTSTV
ncbi:transporter suffix domain-containing protein [Pseudomonas sp. CT11-2]|jgi:hypothetical protein|uniref:transporter suffix domain-containing protein n=1 Tax=unclassified Pseudomonas TaxID=196821 RepID=UPI0003818036|nr:transporter suffix domain-containing protein [Pseudomonas sp. B21-019]UVM35730.1 transporter suffix domain-containing protein [Pseudomonas sp. B21-019]